MVKQIDRLSRDLVGRRSGARRSLRRVSEPELARERTGEGAGWHQKARQIVCCRHEETQRTDPGTVVRPPVQREVRRTRTA